MAKGVTRHYFDNDLPDDQRYLSHFAHGRLFGFIYFIVSQELRIVKIGATNRWKDLAADVDSRMTEIQLGAPFVNVSRQTAIACSTLGKSEPQVHDHFREYCIRGEWFQYTGDLKTFVDQVTLLNDEYDRYSDEAETYRQHVNDMKAAGNEPTLPIPDWPNVKPWKLLDTPAEPPAQKIVGFQPVFETS